MKKTFFTSHIGSAVDHIRSEITMEAAYNIVQALYGSKPQSAINDLSIIFLAG